MTPLRLSIVATCLFALVVLAAVYGIGSWVERSARRRTPEHLNRPSARYPRPTVVRLADEYRGGLDRDDTGRAVVPFRAR